MSASEMLTVWVSVRRTIHIQPSEHHNCSYPILGNNLLDSSTTNGHDGLERVCGSALSEGIEDMAEYAIRKYGKGEIDRAGQILLKWWVTPEISLENEPYNESYRIVQNWMDCHAFPLIVFQRMLRRRAREIDPKVTVAKRIKRLPSVMNKLDRESQMKLSQMQDLGGCRAIVADVSSVYRLDNLFKEIDQTASPPWTIKRYDYIKNPKSDGYRGVHIVGRYVARHERYKPWEGQRIEIQLRSKLQHAFATAVETVTTFTSHRLKFGGGPDAWRRFFALMGSALAYREATPPTEGTPEDQVQLAAELRQLSIELGVKPCLTGWTDALTQLRRRNIRDYKWLLVVLNRRDNSVEVTGYKDMMEASSVTSSIEKARDKDIDAVRVWVNSITELKRAYPNYYADTREFIGALDYALKGQ